MVTQTATWVRHPSEAEVTTVSELRVNNLIIQKALVLTAKGGSAEAKQVTFPPS